MNRKQIISVAVAVIGVILIILALHARSKVNEARNFAEKTQDFFVNNPGWNPIITFFGGAAEKELSKYNKPIIICLSLGIIFVVVGSWSAYGFRNKK